MKIQLDMNVFNFESASASKKKYLQIYDIYYIARTYGVNCKH